MDGQVDGDVGIIVVSSCETYWSLKAVQPTVYVCLFYLNMCAVISSVMLLCLNELQSRS